MVSRPAPEPPAEAPTTFGPFLRYLRKRQRLTQQAVGIAVGYSTAQISLLENGRRLPDLTTLAALFVPLFDLGHEPQFAARLLRLAAAERTAAGADSKTGDTGVRGRAQEHAAEAGLPMATELAPRPGRLPAPLWPLIGREAEQAEVQRLLASPGIRLVTLLGPPGVGKTRLALQIGTEIGPQFAGSADWVDLSELAEAGTLAAFIRQTLHITPPAQGTEAAEEKRLCEALGGQLLLLIMDNFEHVVAQASLVGKLLTAAPGLKILATSRVALGVYGEYQFPVPLLPVPNLAVLPAPTQLAEVASVSLFVARAQAVRPDFALTRENALAVAATCVRLEGLPLALELAAAQLKTLTPAELAARLVNRLDALARGPRNRPARQQTLRGAIDWSYQRLTTDEQTVFQHLGVFAGGFTAEAAQAILGAASATRASLDALCEANLVQAKAAADETRFSLLETLRDFALEQLAAQGATEAAQQQHASYFLALAEGSEPYLIGPEQKIWFDRLGRELANLRAALAWTSTVGGRPASVTGLRLAAALGAFWEGRGHMQEGRTWLEAGLQHAKQAPPEVRAKALLAAGRIALRQGYLKESQKLLSESRNLYLRVEEARGLSQALANLGIARLRQGEPEAARPLLEESLAIARGAQDGYAEAGALQALAEVAYRRGDYATALANSEVSLALSQARRDPRATAGALLNTALYIFQQGNMAIAGQRLEASLEVARELDDYQLVNLCLLHLGNVLIAQGEPALARARLEEALANHLAHHDERGARAVLGALGRALELVGELPVARARQRRALQLRAEAGDQRGVSVSLSSLASLDQREARPVRAAWLLGQSEAIRQAIGVPISPESRADYEALVVSLRRVLGEAAFSEAWATGRAATQEQAVVLALEP